MGAGTVVLLPPQQGVDADLTLLAARLRAAGHRVLVVDAAPGTGQVARQRQALRALAALPGGPVLVGLGVGGQVGQFLAVHRAVAGLVGDVVDPAELGLPAPPEGVPVRSLPPAGRAERTAAVLDFCAAHAV
ncbi:hypothetical protein [Kineococcus sp. SYSU DK006]|uniref:hypothetical protein n=1 Tax=Kineococcus sp. SYSU DK006 TaxID=3383127 RepID=UPI003D7D7F0A